MLMTIFALCLFAQWALYAGKRGDRAHAALALGVVAIMAIAFINAQAFVWHTMAVPIKDELLRRAVLRDDRHDDRARRRRPRCSRPSPPSAPSPAVSATPRSSPPTPSTGTSPPRPTPRCGSSSTSPSELSTMFTTGSKLLIGSAFAAALFALVYGVTQEGSLGTIGLISAAVGLALLAAINVFVRDSNVSAMEPEAFESLGRRPQQRASQPVAAADRARRHHGDARADHQPHVLRARHGGDPRRRPRMARAGVERAGVGRPRLQPACPQHPGRPDRTADRRRDRRRHPDLLVQPHHARPADEDRRPSSPSA